MKQKTITVIGIGNSYRSDDGLGVEILRRLEGEGLPNVEIVEASGEGAYLIESIKNKNYVLVFDAVSSGAEPGTIFRFEAHKEPIPTEFFNYSTHAFSLAEGVELARTLNQMPEKLLVYGIEGEDFKSGVELSAKIKRAIPEVIKLALTDLKELVHESKKTEVA